jgi:hypothetical protein
LPREVATGPLGPDFRFAFVAFQLRPINQELIKAGIMLVGEGLKPSSTGVRLRFSGKDRIVTDGPSAETKELVAGYWIWEVKSMDEAITWLKRCPNPMTEDSEVEIRPIWSLEDIEEAIERELQQDRNADDANSFRDQRPRM